MPARDAAFRPRDIFDDEGMKIRSIIITCRVEDFDVTKSAFFFIKTKKNKNTKPIEISNHLISIGGFESRLPFTDAARSAA